MAWIESHEEIGDHKKTQWLTEALGCNVPEAVGYLHLLWHYTLKVAWKDGDLSDFIPPAIERACWWQGESGALIKAFQASGYMDGLKIHGWKEYAKHIIYQRLYNEKRRKESTPFPQAHYSRNTDVRTAATVPNRTVPNQTIEKNTDMSTAIKATTHLGLNFEAIWSRYPRKLGRSAAERHFKASVKTPQDFLDIQNALDCFIRQMRKEDRPADKIPYGSTWFNGWRDWVNYGDMPMFKPPPPKPRAPDPKPEDCIGPQEIGQLAAALAQTRRMP